MRRAFLLLVIVFAGLAQAQNPPPGQPQPAAAPDPLQAVETARILYVARTLQLRQDQMQPLLTLLTQAQARLKARNEALDALWQKGANTFSSADGAIIAGRQPTQAAVSACQRTVAAHDDVRDKTAADLDRMAAQVLALLDKTQLSRVETPQQAQAQNAQRSQALVDAVKAIALYVGAMRQLDGDEYDTLRVPMAMRLAGRLVAPNQGNYNKTVGDVLRIMDTVRRLSDAEFSQRESQLPWSIARALQVPDPPAAQVKPISYDDIMALLTNPFSSSLMQIYKPAPAMEVVP